NKIEYNQEKSHLWRINYRGVRRMALLALVLMWMALLGGCGFLSGPEVEPTPTQPAERELVPTWTPTPVQATSAPEPPTATPLPPPASAEENPADTPAEEDPASTPVEEDPAST